jgi:hypothetical protein
MSKKNKKTQPVQKQAQEVSKQTILYSSDRRKGIIAQITSSMGGKDAPYKAIKEFWQNSSDAFASQVLISYIDGVFTFQDNGKGISEHGRIALMSYNRSEKTHIPGMGGKHGSGIKKSLALAIDQNYSAAVMIVESVEEGSNQLYTFTITLDYLTEYNSLSAEDEQGAMQLAAKNTKIGPIPDGWMTKNGMKRSSGTDVMLYYVEIPKLQEMKKILPKYLAPAAWSKVGLIINGKRNSLTPLIFPGSLFETHRNVELLGTVSCKFFVQSGNKGIIFCDDNNHHTTLDEVINRVPDVSDTLITLASIASGWITIANLNEWRGENSSLNRKFYNQPYEKLVAYLEMIKPQIEQLLEAQKPEQDAAPVFKFSDLTSVLTVFSRSRTHNKPFLGGVSGISNTLKFGKKDQVKQEICLYPDSIIMPIDSVEIFSIKNHGSEKLDPKKWIWDDTDSPVKIYGNNQGNEVMLMSKGVTTKGISSMILTHPDYKKGIKKIILPVEVIKEHTRKIIGPGTVIAGNEAIYKILHHTHKMINWKISSTGDWHLQDDMVAITVKEDHIVLNTKVLTSKKSITLSAIDINNEMTWATKIIEIYPQMGNRDSVLVIADHEFLVKEQASRAGLDRPLADCIYDKSENLPVIYFDNYNVLVNSSSMNPIQQAINSILIAALSYLVQNNSIDAKEIPILLQEFLLFANKKVNFTTK